MSKKRYNSEEYPVLGKAEKTERDANGKVVRCFSQISPSQWGDTNEDFVAHLESYIDDNHPAIVAQIQQNQLEWMDHLLSHLNDD